MSLVMHLVWSTRKTQNHWCIQHINIGKHTVCSLVKISWTSIHYMVKHKSCSKVFDCEIVILWEQRHCSVSTFIWEITCLFFFFFLWFFCRTGPRDKRPFPSSRFSWSYPSSPWYSGSYIPVSFKDTCNPDLTFDAVTTVGEAIFFFRDKYVDHIALADT